MRRADADMKNLEDTGSAGLSQKAHQAAYACACSLVVASQQKEQFFQVLLEKPGNDEGLVHSFSSCASSHLLI